MAVRKTESRIPQIPGFTIDDLGQNATSGTNASVKIVSYLSSPLAVNIFQNYVVFVEDAALQPNVASYEWIFNNNGTITNATTRNGVNSFLPTVVGTLSVTVNLKDGANTTLHTVALQQQVAARNLELEQLIDQEGTSSPSAGNPTVSRDVINGLRIFADAAASPVTDNALNRLILSITYSNLSANNPTLRNTLLENCSAALETTPDTFFTTGQNGIGVTKLRPHLAAMFIQDGGNPLIPVTERPSVSASTATQTTIQTAFNGLPETRRIDIFNLLRFPKTNIRICKLVLDGLKARYFSTEAFPAVLGNRNKARRLIREYETGPYTPPASATSDLSSTSASIFTYTLMAVWRISVSAVTNPAGNIDPQTRLFGIPEPIPEKAFLANFGIFTGDEPFIRSGRTYHSNFGITFTTVVSLEEIITHLQANATIFNHFRIFTHANQDLLGISLFVGGSGFVEAEHLDGFATSELQGVMGIINRYLPGRYIFSTDLADNFLDFLRSQSNTALNPFNLQAATPPATNPTLSADLRELFRRYIDIWAINMPGMMQVETGPTTAPRNLDQTTEVPVFIAVEDVIIRLLKPGIISAIPGLTDAHFTSLRTAILGTTPANLGFTGPVPSSWQPFPVDSFTSMSNDFRSTARALAVGNTFMSQLAHVKSRFDSNSFVDIRGCRAGLMAPFATPPPPFLLSIQRFFGRTGALPTVTAPEWFQSFRTNFRNEPLADNAAIDNQFATPYNNITAGVQIQLTTLEISNAFDDWSSRSKLDDQFTFFTNLFSAGADLVDFASLRWRTWQTSGSTTGIPALNLLSSRADDMVQLSLGNLINRLRENFTAAGSNLAPAVVTKLNALQPKIADLRTNEDQLAAFTGADFTAFYNNLSALATQILAIPGMPAATTTLVPATMPTPLTRADITGYLSNIRAYLTSSLNTDIGPVFSNIRTAIGGANANAKRHYYFNLRLPLRVPTTRGTFVQFVIFYIAGAVGEAIRSYLKCQWTGTPSQIADMHTFIDDPARGITESSAFNFLLTATLVETETAATPNAIAPLPDYSSHIKST